MIEEQEMKTMENFSFVGEKVPVIVVGRNNDKRIVNVVWGKEKEGYFRWPRKGNLPNYTDVFYLSFDQKEPRGVLKVSNVSSCNDYSSFTSDFYKQETLEITAINEREYYCGDLLLPQHFSSALRSCELGSKILLTWVYKFNHRVEQFEWMICRVKVLVEDVVLVEEEDEVVKEVAVVAQEPARVEAKEVRAVENVVREDVTLFVMACDTPLKGVGLVNHCLSSSNELYYFHSSLLSVVRFDKLKLNVSVGELAGVKMITEIHKVEPAILTDFPDTIVKETKKMLIHRNDVMYLDSDPIPSRKSQNLRLKKLLAIAGANRVEVIVEEAFIYAIQNKAFEWTIVKVSLANDVVQVKVEDPKPAVQEEVTKEEEKPTTEVKSEVVAEDEAMAEPKKTCATETRAIVEEKPKKYKTVPAYIVSVGSGTIDLIFGECRKAYIVAEKYSLENPTVGQWLEIDVVEGQKNFEELDFKDIRPFPQNPLFTPSCRQFYRVREGLLIYSEDDRTFMLNNIPIPDYVLDFITEPRYKAYYRFEEILDYNPVRDKFVYKCAKMSELEFVQGSAEELDEHLYPLRLRNKLAFEEALAKLCENVAEDTSSDVKDETAKTEVKSPKVKSDKACPIIKDIRRHIVSFSVQSKTKRIVRKGLRQKRAILSKKRK